MQKIFMRINMTMHQDYDTWSIKRFEIQLWTDVNARL